MRLRSTAPTMNPAISYSPAAIKPRHLRSLAADERATSGAARAAHTLDHLFHHCRIHFAQRQVVQKKKRLGAQRQNVVDAVVHEVRANRRMHAHREGHFQLCADAVRARNEQRLAPPFPVQRKERAKSADPAYHVARKRPAGQPRNALLCLLGEFDVYACFGVAHGPTLQLLSRKMPHVKG